ncbi:MULTISPECIES: hypothetical protein [unclassified Nocardioides]|uniref:recombination directionality factor n=1 Tax=unclassified Nocardioides TaxID=2615069 RepID=UPI0009EFB805|nr:MULTISPECIES: hypothetical protein [unclassified Nocardioides]GAW50582.1 Putative uncharacterized protein [Nocardioides sp. PD653-B2]GAW57467.1 putative uncharacterized protein [Nocardioides sp. PD653]
MPIKPIVLQRRHAELGRIRLGAKRDGSGAPMKLASFRFTSPSEQYIKDLAELYGGEARPWDNGGKPEFEVFTEASTIDVIAVKGGLSQWMETWSGGGCVHRCDGEVNTLTNQACNPNDPAHKNAKPTTRLSLMLPELEAMGVWRMESHGWNAAAEIPAVAELALFVGDLVPAVLHMVERRSVRDGKTSRFVVPVLDLRIGVARLKEIVAQKSGMAPAELEAGAGQEHPALQSGAPAAAANPFAPFLEKVAATRALDDLAGVWDAAKAAGLVGTTAADTEQAREFVGVWKARAHQLREAEKAAQQPAAAEPDGDGVVDAVLVEDPDVIWTQILAAGAAKGLDTLDAVSDDFKAQMGGLLPDDASAAELQHYLGLLTAERVA